jgi:putative DNA primase/helicase
MTRYIDESDIQDALRLKHAESDMGNARRLVLDHHHQLRYVPRRGWFTWNGTRWTRDDDGQAMRFAKETVRRIEIEAATLFEAAAREPDHARRDKALNISGSRREWAKRSQNLPRLKALLTCASTEPELVATAENLDGDRPRNPDGQAA